MIVSYLIFIKSYIKLLCTETGGLLRLAVKLMQEASQSEMYVHVQQP